ncbi:hypothetical protein CUMW_082850 [Citrus unshiu]|nr:hypothetical protein CUMW_082850 [Citrus unshiu]
MIWTRAFLGDRPKMKIRPPASACTSVPSNMGFAQGSQHHAGFTAPFNIYLIMVEQKLTGNGLSNKVSHLPKRESTFRNFQPSTSGSTTKTRMESLMLVFVIDWELQDVKQNLHQIEMEMSKIRSRKVGMKKDVVHNLSLHSDALKHPEEDSKSRIVYVPAGDGNGIERSVFVNISSALLASLEVYDRECLLGTIVEKTTGF